MDGNSGDGRLSLHDDGERIGHAVLSLASPRDTAPALALRFPDGTALGADGRRSRELHLFATEPVGPPPLQAVRLGPEVTAHVREAEIVTFVDAGGTALGTLVWEGVRPPPAAGGRARLAGSGPGRRLPGTTRLVVPERREAIPASVQPAAPVGQLSPRAVPLPSPQAASELPGLAGPPPPPSASPSAPARRIGRATLFATLLIVAAAVCSVLAGLVGWRLEPTSLAFSGPVAGPFRPTLGEVRLRLAWYASPFLRSRPVPADSLPDWLVAKQTRDGQGWVIAISPSGRARDLAAGKIAVALPLAFPLRRYAESLRVTLDVGAARDIALGAADTGTQGAGTSHDDTLCDRLAGNRFDDDHPTGTPNIDEIFKLSSADVEAGLAACDASPVRTGEARRFAVQRGRLLAHRALVRLAASDAAGAGADMEAAVALWRHGDELGSTYAANLLGAFYGGTFNRPSHDFVVADDRAANDYWRRAMEGGNTVAQRNFAAQLLAGKGVAADPPRAMALLRNAADKGEERAAGILGAALFTGKPAGVTRDEAAAWPLLVAAQCADKHAAVLVAAEVAAGRRPVSGQRDCR